MTLADVGDAVLPVAAALLAAGATMSWDLIPLRGGPAAIFTNVATFIFGASTIGTVVLALMAGRRSLHSRSDARSGTSRFAHSLGGATIAVENLLASDMGDAAGRRFIDEIAVFAKDIMPLRDVRATVYSIDFGDTEDGKKRLVRIGMSRGRNDQARESFSRSTDHGAELIGFVEGRTPRYIKDFRKTDITHDRDDEAVWESYAVIPLRAGEEAWGGLLVDSTRPSPWTRDQKDLALAIGRFLEIGLSCLVSGAEEDLAQTAADVQKELAEAGEDVHEFIGGAL